MAQNAPKSKLNEAHSLTRPPQPPKLIEQWARINCCGLSHKQLVCGPASRICRRRSGRHQGDWRIQSQSERALTNRWARRRDQMLLWLFSLELLSNGTHFAHTIEHSSGGKRAPPQTSTFDSNKSMQMPVCKTRACGGAIC